MRNLMIATLLVACNTNDTTETEAATETVQTENTAVAPVDVVDQEAKQLKQQRSDFNTEGETFTTEDNNVDDFEEIEENQ